MVIDQGGLPRSVVIFCFAHHEQSAGRKQRRRGEIVADVLQAITPGEPSGDIGANDAPKMAAKSNASELPV